jgi:predicted dithiol-disulfide oxidoreductase (DUF899 family)
MIGRGLDAINGAYQLLDRAPKGRDGDDLPWTMAWLRGCRRRNDRGTAEAMLTEDRADRAARSAS